MVKETETCAAGTCTRRKKKRLRVLWDLLALIALSTYLDTIPSDHIWVKNLGSLDDMCLGFPIEFGIQDGMATNILPFKFKMPTEHFLKYPSSVTKMDRSVCDLELQQQDKLLSESWQRRNSKTVLREQLTRISLENRALKQSSVATLLL